MITPSKSYFPAIDGIRALAVLAVVLFHLDIPLFSGGFVGVDVFFVISGYLITRNIVLAIEQGDFSFIQFYISRIRRLFPAFFATILICLVFGFLFFSPDALIRLSTSAIAAAVSLANVRFWLSSGYFDVDASLKPLLHFWSLSVEEQFYVFWPLSLWLGIRYLNKRFLLLLAVIVVGLISLIASHYYLRINSSASFYLVPFRIYEFAIGAAVFFFPANESANQIKQNLIRELAAVTGLLLVIIPIVSFSSMTLFPGVNALFPCSGAALLIYFRDSKLASLFLANILMRSIGKVSYSLYLVHWPIWVYYSYWRITPLQSLEKMGLFLLMLILAFSLYFFVEKRFRYSSTKNLRDDKPSKKTSSLLFIGFLFLIFTMIISVSWVIREKKGIPQRILNVHTELTLADLNCKTSTSKQFQNCLFGALNNYEKTVLLIGDSHSMSLRAGLHYYGQNNGIRFKSISAAGCPPLLGVHLYHPKQVKPDQQCIKFSNQLSSELKKTDVDILMLVGRWMWFFEHKAYGGHNNSIGYLVTKQQRNIEIDKLNSESSRLVWKQHLRSTISAIQLKVPKVIVFSQAPLMQKGIGECNKAPEWLVTKESHNDRCRVSIPFEEIMRRLQFTNQTIESLTDVNIMTIKPSDYICDSKKKSCNILSDKGLYYHDSDHLSQLGAIYLIESVAEDLKAFLNQ